MRNSLHRITCPEIAPIDDNDKSMVPLKQGEHTFLVISEAMYGVRNEVTEIDRNKVEAGITGRVKDLSHGELVYHTGNGLSSKIVHNDNAKPILIAVNPVTVPGKITLESYGDQEKGGSDYKLESEPVSCEPSCNKSFLEFTDRLKQQSGYFQGFEFF